MKSRTFILCNIIIFQSVFYSSACAPDNYYPADYLLPRIYDPTDKPVVRLQSIALMEDWKELTDSYMVRTSDIEEVVNNYSLQEIKRIMNTSKPSNSFAAWILTNKRNDIIDYLVVAKECEQARSLYNSRWYYPSKDDGLEMTLEDIRDLCIERAKQDGKLVSRYILQTIRAMMTLHDYDGISSFWEKTGGSVPDGVIREMCLGYMSRVKFEQGFCELAIEEYSKAGDISSVEFCLQRMNRDYNTLDLVEYVAKYSPNNDYIPKTLQQWFSKNLQFRQIIDSSDANHICRISDIAVSNKECQNPAMWLYCKALALDLSGRPFDAKNVNIKAASAKGTAFIKNSIRVFDIWLDAKTAVYDKGYEQRLLRDLIWLDKMIADNLTDEIRSSTIEKSWYLKNNRSYYYWNDMLKKIILGMVCPRLIEDNNEVLAIRLANMADNRLLALVGKEFRNSTYNEFDYCNTFFKMLNREVCTQSIEMYVASLDKPSNALEIFLDIRGFIDRSYLLDVLGTRYIREHLYADAVRVLESVPSAYQYRLNTAVYMNRDPFQPAFNEQDYIFIDYKLNFARKMEEYARTIDGHSGPDEKGRAKVRMGIAISAASSFAWPLTEYSYSSSSYWFEDDNSSKEEAYAHKLIRQGLLQIRDSEVMAQELLYLQRRLEVVQKYKGTMASRYILQHCDEYRNYKMNSIPEN